MNNSQVNVGLVNHQPNLLELRAVRAAPDRLMANLSAREIPLALVSQFFPASYEAVYEGKIKSNASELVQASIRRALAGYPAAYSSIIA